MVPIKLVAFYHTTPTYMDPIQQPNWTISSLPKHATNFFMAMLF